MRLIENQRYTWSLVRIKKKKNTATTKLTAYLYIIENQDTD